MSKLRRMFKKDEGPSPKSWHNLARMEAVMYEIMVNWSDVSVQYQLGVITEQEMEEERSVMARTLAQFGSTCKKFDEPGDENRVFHEAMERLQIRGSAEGEFKMTIEKIEGGEV